MALNLRAKQPSQEPMRYEQISSQPTRFHTTAYPRFGICGLEALRERLSLAFEARSEAFWFVLDKLFTLSYSIQLDGHYFCHERHAKDVWDE